VVARGISGDIYTIKIPVSIQKLVVHDPDGRLYNNPDDPKGGQDAVPRWVFTVKMSWSNDQWKLANYGGGAT
jgi:hypothetical protein